MQIYSYLYARAARRYWLNQLLFMYALSALGSVSLAIVPHDAYIKKVRRPGVNIPHSKGISPFPTKAGKGELVVLGAEAESNTAIVAGNVAVVIAIVSYDTEIISGRRRAQPPRVA